MIGAAKRSRLRSSAAGSRSVRFSAELLATLRVGKGLRIRAGRTHRFIGVWVVVVEGRVFVRSWGVKARGWHRAFVAEPRGAIKVGGRTIAVAAVRTRSERVIRAVDRAYLAKYSTGWELKYAKDLANAKSRATTTELRPA